MSFIGFSLVVIVCLLLGAGAGFAVGHHRAIGQWIKDVRQLESAVEEKTKALKSAEVDQQIVRALRSGDIGVADLHEAGFENVRQDATGALAIAAPEPPAPPAEYMFFVPLLYERDVKKVETMVPGDEVWIALSSVRHRADGDAALWKNTECAPRATSQTRTRLRYYNGKHELGIDPTDPMDANGGITEATYRMDYVVVLRPEDRFGSSNAKPDTAGAIS